MNASRWLPRAALSALSALFVACSAQPPSPPTAAGEPSPASSAAGSAPQATARLAAPAAPADAGPQATALATQLQQAIGDAACSTDAQCHTIAWGTKACGGPERWVAWSSMKSDAGTVQQLAERYGAARRADHLRTGGMSTCSIVADPGARCVAQHCALTTEAARALE